jgi:general bacterial porin, GBP family
MYNKKALVVAVGLALSIPAFAYAAKGDEGGSSGKPEPDSVVELYGKAYPEYAHSQGKDATAKGQATCTICAPAAGENGIRDRTLLEASNTRLGVRGHEKLGGGLKAIFQLETEWRVDQNDTPFAARDSFVGLDHARWGTIKLGRMDTPFKNYGDELSFLGVSSGNFTSSSNVLRKTGFGTNSASSFHLRRQNAVQYETPDFAGFNGAVQYSTDETDTLTRHPHVWSGAIAWEGGPLKFSIAHERHWDLFGGSRNVPTAMSNFNDQNVRSKDKATQVMAIYKLGVHRFEADYIRKEYDENATLTGRFNNYKNNAYELIWDARWNRQWRTMVSYIKSLKGSCSRVNAVCTTDGLDGAQFQVGAAYYFSRRTYMFAMAAWLRNDPSARYNNDFTDSPNPGEDITIYALGISHSW